MHVYIRKVIDNNNKEENQEAIRQMMNLTFIYITNQLNIPKYLTDCLDIHYKKNKHLWRVIYDENDYL